MTEARGVILRDDGEEILDSLSRSMQGKIVVQPSPAGPTWPVPRLQPERTPLRIVPADPLTVREREIVRLLAQGHRPAAIAQKLFISRRTVEGHLAHAYRKLGVRSSIQAIHAFLRAENSA